MVLSNKISNRLSTFFLIGIITIYPLYYFESFQILGITYAKFFELILISFFLLLSFIVLPFNLKINKVIIYFILFYVVLIIKLLLYNDNIIEFLKKEYFIFYWFIFFIIGYSLSTNQTYNIILIVIKRIFLFIVIVGVLFFILGIDYKLEIYSQAEGMFYHPYLGVNRATSFVYNPQIFGMFCVMTLLLYKNNLIKIFGYLGLFFSFSRSSILAYMFSIIFQKKINKNKKIIFILLFTFINLFILGTFFHIGGLFDRFFNLNTYLEDVRVLKYLVAIYFLVSNIKYFLFGMPYDTNISLDGISFSDNTYLYIAIQGGFFLLSVFFYLLYKIFLKIKEERNLLILFIASLISGFFTISFAYISFDLFFFLIGSYFKFRSLKIEKSISS